MKAIPFGLVGALAALLGACAPVAPTSSTRHAPPAPREQPVLPEQSVVPERPAPRATYGAPLDVRFMKRGYFHAYAEMSNGLGSNAMSDDLPRGATAGRWLSIIALPAQGRPFEGAHDGFRVLVINASEDAVLVPAQDARLSMVHEALDARGVWAPIEYLPTSWCGNSYHTLELPARSYWELTAPRYTGSMATRLRLKLTIRRGGQERHVHSNTWEGHVNPEQFTIEEAYRPAGIVDPYEPVP